MESGTCLNVASTPKTEVITDVIGGHGPWQFRCWCVFFLASLCSSMQLFAVFPLSSNTRCSCSNISLSEKVRGGTGDSLSNCSSSDCISLENSIFQGEPCQIKFSGTVHTWQGETHCSYIHVVAHAKCVFVLGCLLASIATYPLMFRFGRRPVCLTYGCLLFAAVLATSWATNQAAYLVLRFIISVPAIGVYLMAVSSMCEFVGAEYVHLYGLTGHMGWGLAHLLLPLITWVTGTWASFNWSLSFVTFLLLASLCFIPDSMESYTSRRLWSRADKLIQTAAHWNGYSVKDLNTSMQTVYTPSEAENLVTPFFPFRRENLRMYMEIILQLLIGLLSSFQYFTLMWLSDWYSERRATYFALLATTEIASSVVLLFVTCFISSKHIWAVTATMASTLMIVMFLKTGKDMAVLSTSSYLPSTFFASAAWTLVLLRTVRLSTCSQSRRKGRAAVVFGIGICLGMLLSALPDLQKFQNWCPTLLLVSAIPSFVIGLCSGFLPGRLLNLFLEEKYSL